MSLNLDQDLVQSVMRHTTYDSVYHITNLPDAVEDASPATLGQLNNGLAAKQYTLTAGDNITIDNSNPLAPIISATNTTLTVVDGGSWE